MNAGCVVVGCNVVAPSAVIKVAAAKRNASTVGIALIVIAGIVVTYATLVCCCSTSPYSGAILFTGAAIWEKRVVVIGIVIADAAIIDDGIAIGHASTVELSTIVIWIGIAGAARIFVGVTIPNAIAILFAHGAIWIYGIVVTWVGITNITVIGIGVTAPGSSAVLTASCHACRSADTIPAIVGISFAARNPCTIGFARRYASGATGALPARIVAGVTTHDASAVTACVWVLAFLGVGECRVIAVGARRVIGGT